MAKIDKWMPFYIGDYLSDTMRLTTEQHGAYLLLIFEYWKNGPLPDDDGALASIAKMSLKAWKATAVSIRPYFERHADGKLHQKRVDQERAKVTEISEKRRTAAKSERKGAKPDEQVTQQNHVQTNSKTEAKAPAKPPTKGEQKSSKSHHTRIARQPQPQPPGREVTTQPEAPDLARARGADDRTPRIGDPPEAWGSLAEGWSNDRDGVRRPTRNGDFLDITAELALKAGKLNPDILRPDWRALVAWMDAGIDAPDIIAAIEEVAAARSYDPSKVGSLAYFDRAVRARKASKT